jgi:hypothetical protein
MRSWIVCLAIVLSLCGLSKVFATTMIALDLPALVDQSDYVVVGNAHSESARYSNGSIVTDVTLEVITSVKGPAKPGETLVVTHLGGAVGDVGMHVPGAANFRIGESALVFLSRAKEHTLNVTGMSQGLMRITGTGSGAQVMPAAAGGATLMKRDEDGKLVTAPNVPQKPRALADLLAEIEQLAASH